MRTLAAVGLLVLVPALASAQVYRWEDRGGTLYYTNSPETIPDSYRGQIGTPPPPTSAAAEPDPAPAPVEARSTVTRIPYTPGDPILVSARIAGIGPLTLILDTGADRTMIAPQALARLGLSLANAPYAEIRGVTGSGQAPVLPLLSLEVGEARVASLRIIAHDADLKNADGLLGRDFLQQFTVTIDSTERVVTLAPR
jgi:hypothetical protein